MRRRDRSDLSAALYSQLSFGQTDCSSCYARALPWIMSAAALAARATHNALGHSEPSGGGSRHAAAATPVPQAPLFAAPDLLGGDPGMTTKRLFAHATAEMQSIVAPLACAPQGAWPAAGVERPRALRAKRSAGKCGYVEARPLPNSRIIHRRAAAPVCVQCILVGAAANTTVACICASAGPAPPGLALDRVFTWMQVFPRSSTQAPGLLKQIERTLQHESRRATAAASGGSALAPACSLGQLRAHSKALDAFIAGFPTYAPLLRRIKGEMHAALDEAVATGLRSVDLRAQLTDVKAAREAAVEHAYAQARNTSFVSCDDVFV